MEKNPVELKSWEHLIKPYRIAFEKQEGAGCFENIIIEPLEKGFGITLGNALRRILLSSIQGTAVTSVKIAGTFLEFSSLPGVMEDVTDIVLNIKTLNLRLHGTGGTEKFLISAKGPCVVTAEMIQGGTQLDILDPSQKICTLEQGASFQAELYISRGKGYVMAPLALADKQVGEIMLDARFNPVRKVAYRVEHTRVAQSTDYDRLILSVETNGSIPPRDAVSEAAQILQDQLRNFISFEPQLADKKLKVVEQAPRMTSLPQALFNLVKDLDLPVRCLNCLKNAQIVYLGDLVKKREVDLLRTPNFGRKSLNDINEVLARFGLSLGMDFPDWPPENIESHMIRPSNLAAE